jgi:hypothetical protein
VQPSGVVRWTPDRRDDADVFAEDARATAIAEPEQDVELVAERAWARPVHTPDADPDEAELADEALELADADADEDETEAEAAQLELDEPALDEPEPEPEPALAEPVLDEADEQEVALDAPTEKAPPEREVLAQAAPPRPSWEQNNLFEEDDEPVDAYGTPVSLVETLEGEAVEEAAELDEGEEEEEDEELAEAAELEEGEEEDEEYEEEDEDPAAAAELDEDEEEDEEYEEEGEELAEAAELEEGEEEDEEYEEEDEDEDEESAEAAELEEEDPAAEDDGSVLIPQPTPVSEHAKRAALLAPPKQRIYEAGCLFLDRGRVAVSMLQREYSLEFDDACTMLDELQDLGLIGPYLGGKHRDILLTSDEWLERVSAS